MKDRHDDRYDPEPDFDKPTMADEVLGMPEAHPAWPGHERPYPVRPKCPGCGKYIFTETEAATYDADGDAWHLSCYEGTEE